ncbi:hypothetical protein ACP6H1_27475 [Vibrio harveyi]|uniref:hypothetical protein n=1 Tax=Vibrio harveyi TaxID=669 RepID=UPI003CF8B64B
MMEKHNVTRTCLLEMKVELESLIDLLPYKRFANELARRNLMRNLMARIEALDELGQIGLLTPEQSSYLLPAYRDIYACFKDELDHTASAKEALFVCVTHLRRLGN